MYPERREPQWTLFILLEMSLSLVHLQKGSSYVTKGIKVSFTFLKRYKKGYSEMQKFDMAPIKRKLMMAAQNRVVGFLNLNYHFVEKYYLFRNSFSNKSRKNLKLFCKQKHCIEHQNTQHWPHFTNFVTLRSNKRYPLAWNPETDSL